MPPFEQPNQAVDETDDKLAPLYETVLALARESGPDSVTSRGVAERAGVAPSYINYKFGGLSRLLADTRSQADLTRQAFWRRAIENSTEDQIGFNDLSPLIFCTNRSAITAFGGAEDLFWDDIFAVARGDESSVCFASIGQEHEYWRRVGVNAGLPEGLEDILLAFSLSLRFDYLVFDRPEDYDPLALALIGQFTDRLRGNAPEERVDSIYRKQAGVDAQPQSELDVSNHTTARKIIDTTVELILNEGVGVVSHRKIATAAEVSVSSVQHFFGSRQNYVRAAFQEIFNRIVSHTAQHLPTDLVMTVDDLMGQLTERTQNKRLESQKEFGALMNLRLSAAYSKDSGDIARALVVRQGETSGRMLSALLNQRGNIGRLDGQLLSMILSQAQTLRLCASRTGLTQDFELGAFGTRVIKALFV